MEELNFKLPDFVIFCSFIWVIMMQINTFAALRLKLSWEVLLFVNERKYICKKVKISDASQASLKLHIKSVVVES